MDDEEMAMQTNRTLQLDHCRDAGVDPEFLLQWELGIILEGHQSAPRFCVPDYPSVEAHFDRAAEEIDRITAEGKIHWFPQGEEPEDLDNSKKTMIAKPQVSTQ